MSTGLSLPSILTVTVKRSFNRPYQTVSGLRTNHSTPGGRVKTKSSLLYQNFLPGKGPASTAISGVPCGSYARSAISRRYGCVSLPERQGKSAVELCSNNTTCYYKILHINVTWRRRSKTAMSAGRSVAWTSKLLRSEGRGGRPRLLKSSARNS